MKQHWSRDTEETRVTSVQLSLSHTHTHTLTYPHYSLFWKYGLFGFINTEENFEKESYFTNLLFLLAKCQINKHFPIISHYSKSFSTNLTKTFNRFLFQRRPEKGEHCLVVLSSKSPFNLVAFYCPQFVSHLCLGLSSLVLLILLILFFHFLCFPVSSDVCSNFCITCF